MTDDEATKLRARLLVERKMLIVYMQTKIEAEDWHGVADSAMDLCEIDVQLTLMHRFGK